MKFKNLVIIALVALLAMSVVAGSTKAKNNVFGLSIKTVKKTADGYTAINTRFAEGDTVLLKVDYHTPYTNGYDGAVEGVNEFNLVLKSNVALKNIKLKAASTLICTDVSCAKHDTIDVLDFNKNTIHMTYGYSGYVIFEATFAKEADADVSVQMCYGTTSSPIYTERANCVLKHTEPHAAPTTTANVTSAPLTTAEPTVKNTPIPTQTVTGIPSTGSDTIIIPVCILFMIAVSLIVISAKRTIYKNR